MAFEVDDKTEQPTERRRRRAREDGLGPRSADLSVACRLLGVAVALQFFAGPLFVELAKSVTESLQRPLLAEVTADSVVSTTWDTLVRVALPFLGGWACIWAGSLTAHALQVGWR